MLRGLYACLLRLHPPYFRQRYAEEMLWIFDQASGTRAVARLMADAVLSLARQWTLRPEFLERPIASEAGGPAFDAVPAFHMFGNSAPRAAALVNGGVVSLVVFGAVFLGMAYGWGHPALSELLPGGRSARDSRMSAMRRSTDTPAASTAPGRQYAIEVRPTSLWSMLLLLLRKPAATRMQPGLEVLETPPARQLERWVQAFNAGNPEVLRGFSQTAGAAPGTVPDARKWLELRDRFGPLELREIEQSTPHRIVALAQTRDGLWWRLAVQVDSGRPAAVSARNEELLRPCVGTYVLEPPDGRVIVVTLENGELSARIGGEEKRALVAESGTKFVPAGVTNRWFEFVTAPGGEVTTVHLFETERKTARRQ